MLNKIISKDIITKKNTPLIFEMFHTIRIYNSTTKQYIQVYKLEYETDIKSIDEIEKELKTYNSDLSFCGFMAREYDDEISISNDHITIYKPVNDVLQKGNAKINWCALGEQEITDAELFFKVGLEAVYIANALQDQWNKQHTTEK